MSITLDGTTGVTFNDTSLQGAAASPYVLKNRIINGDMRIDQRNAGASVTINGAAPYVLDRYFAQDDTDGTFTVQQSSVAPSGFTNSMLVTVTAADTSLGATQLARITQRIEGYNVADLGFGTASASTITISFWVRSSVTGTFGGSLVNGAGNRSYPFSYTILAANTWEKETITIVGDTSGTWLTTNGIGLELNIGLAAGSTYTGASGSWSGSLFFNATGATNLMATNGATFYITGVQLEQNTSATPFERRLYGQELINCQRYFEKNFPQTVAPAHNTGYVTFLPIGGSAGCGGNTYWSVNYKVTKRTDCTIRAYDPTGSGSASSNLYRVYTACDSGTQGSTFGLLTACDTFFAGYTQSGTNVTTAFIWTAECEL
jgi:hypothetical protein